MVNPSLLHGAWSSGETDDGHQPESLARWGVQSPENIKAVADAYKRNFARTVNLKRRHMSREGRDQVIVAIPGDSKTERQLHKQFAADRLCGEWFAFSPALASYIEELL